MATSVPIEISDEIIDCVYDDRGTLLSCSLTCRSWRARSQYHLFNFFSLDRRELERIERLSALLTDSSHLVAHIRHVELPVDLERCDSFLSLCPLPYVKELTLTEPGSRFTFCGLSVRPVNDYAHRLATAFPNTRSVTCMYIDFDHFSALLELVRAFPCLVHVCLSGTVLRNLQTHLTLEPHGPHDPSLLSLRLETYWGNFFEPWLDPCVYPLVQRLRRLQVLFADRDEEDLYHGFRLIQATSMGVLAGRVSRTLEELDIRAFRVETAKDMVAAHGAHGLPNPALRHARISIGPHPANTDSDSTLAVLLAHLRDMCLDYRAKAEVIVQQDEPHTFTWHAAQEELFRAPFPCQLTLDAPGLIYDSAQV